MSNSFARFILLYKLHQNLISSWIRLASVHFNKSIYTLNEILFQRQLIYDIFAPQENVHWQNMHSSKTLSEFLGSRKKEYLLDSCRVPSVRFVLE